MSGLSQILSSSPPDTGVAGHSRPPLLFDAPKDIDGVFDMGSVFRSVTTVSIPCFNKGANALGNQKNFFSFVPTRMESERYKSEGGVRGSSLH